MKKLLSLFFAVMLLTTGAFAFTDTTDHLLLFYIEQASDTGIITGYGDDTFRPDQSVDRAGFVSMMNRALGISGCAVTSFTDVPANAWYAPEVEKALSVGYITGKSAVRFAPTATINRGETAVILARLAGNMSGNCGYPDYSETLPDWLKSGMSFAWESGVFDMFIDRESEFLPYEPMTRAQCAAVITAFLESRDAKPIYLTYCSESDEKLDANGENYLYVNLFGRNLFAELCASYDAEALTFSSPEDAAVAYQTIAEVIQIKVTADNLDITGSYLLELTPDLAYLCFTVTPESEEMASLTLTAEPKSDAYAMAAGFDSLEQSYAERITRIVSAGNLLCTDTDGNHIVTWDKDERLTSYSVLIADADGTKYIPFSGDIVIGTDKLSVDVTETVSSMGLTEGRIVIIGYSNDASIETRPSIVSFGMKTE